jgi:hypothetical protein
MVNIVGHARNKISTLRTLGTMLWNAHYFTNPLHALEVQDVGYNISIALKTECDVLLSTRQSGFLSLKQSHA